MDGDCMGTDGLQKGGGDLGERTWARTLTTGGSRYLPGLLPSAPSGRRTLSVCGRERDGHTGTGVEVPPRPLTVRSKAGACLKDGSLNHPPTLQSTVHESSSLSSVKAVA